MWKNFILLIALGCRKEKEDVSLLDEEIGEIGEIGEVPEVDDGQGLFVDVERPDITTFALLSEIQEGDLVISEVMHSSTQSTFDSYGEWIEIYNASAVAIDLQGLVISSTSTGDTSVIFTNSLVLGAGEYVLLATKSYGNGGLTGVDGYYSFLSIRHHITDDLQIQYAGTVLDAVSWTNGTPSVAVGSSVSLDGDDLSSTVNDATEHWYAGYQGYGDGDGDLGTPGTANTALYMGDALSVGQLIISEMMIDPEVTADWRGEWFEVYNPTNAVVQLSGLSVSSSNNTGFTVDTNYPILPGGYAVLGNRLTSSDNGGYTPNVFFVNNTLTFGAVDDLTISSGAILVDSVSYSNGASYVGYSMNLSPTAYDAQTNDDAIVWCASSEVYGVGDYGTPGTANTSCVDLDYDLDGFSVVAGDCDDSNAEIHPNATEICDGVDNNCNALIDDADATTQYTEDQVWYLDVDGDGYGGIWIDAVYACEAPVDGYGGVYSNNNEDCNDENFLSYPGAVEILDDQEDENCDGWDNSCFFGRCDWGIELTSGVGMDMKWIEGGVEPLGRYTLTHNFYMMTTEVTQAQYESLLGLVWQENKTGYYGVGANYPVYHVSWYMAADFANAVTQYHNQLLETNLQECYTCSGIGSAVECVEAMSPYQCDGYRLPTEAEWEYAARSGTTADIWTGDGLAQGGEITELWNCDTPSVIDDGVTNPLLSVYVWYCVHEDNQVVAGKLPNGYGLYDMHGNEWEWTFDWEGCGYPNSSIDPYCDTVGEKKIRKGGDWNDFPFNIQMHPRYAKFPTDRYASIGFRLLRMEL